jgi:N-acetylornithine carbamoyltransferase
LRRFTDLSLLSAATVRSLLQRADELRSGASSDAARRKTLGLLFFNSSLRTRVSMVAAWARLGGMAVDLTPGQGMWKLATGDAPMLGDEAEHIEEAAGVLGRLCDVLGVRAFASGTDWADDRRDALLANFDKHCRCPVVNMESALFHPCQSLADWLTLDDHAVADHDPFVLSWAYHPKALPQAVPNSAMLMACHRGMNVTILRPDGWSLDPELTARAAALATAHGGSLRETADPAVLKSARVVYAKSWGALKWYSDPKAEAVERAKYRDWCVGAAGYGVGPDTRLMHCLPVRRDVVVSRELLTSKQSVILDQAENRKWAQAAVLERMALAE